MRSQRGNVWLLVLATAAVAAVAISGYFYWQKANKPVSELTWEECVKIPNARILQSYPEICVAPGGTKVTQPFSKEERGTGGIYGIATIGPTCPGPERPGQICTQPYVGAITIVERSDGSAVTSFSTNADGSFRIALPPGDYLARRTDNITFGQAKTPIHVEADLYSKIDLSFDTGIR